jgi:predicted Zn-dependent protease
VKSKILLALSVSLVAVGCATSGIVDQGGTRTVAPQLAQQAAQQHPQIIEEFGGAVGGNVGSYVQTVGARVGAQSGVQANAYTFTTLNTAVLNAFAVPGGYIYITRQLMGIMQDESELASVLGHEAAHIAADHQKTRQNRGMLTQLGALVVGVLTGSGQLAQLAGQVGQGLFFQYTRQQEFEADDLGLRYMTAAGYDPLGAAGMLRSLGTATAMQARLAGQAEDQRSAPTWAQTHPMSADRVARSQQQAQATGRAGQGSRNRDEYLNTINGMLFDDDPRQGVIEGATFLHPDLRLRFTAPQGYGLQNSTRAVGVTGSNGQAMFSTLPFQGNLNSYIAQVFQSILGQQAQVAIPQPRTTTVNGIPAAYSTVRVPTQQGAVDVSVMAYQFSSNQAFHFATITQAGAGFGPFSGMVQSVARLSASEAAAIRPRVIQVATVRAGDTVQSLANRMAYPNYRLERFLMLNGLESNSTLTAGDKVKLVVYGQR